MWNQIYHKIKKYDNIVIARHIGADPDALASQISLKESILLTFPNKKVLAVGNGSAKFSYLGRLDHYDELDSFLLIVLDTPDKKRIDFKYFDKASEVIKIDHHPFIDDFGGIEHIDVEASSTSEILMEFFKVSKLMCNKEIATRLYCGLVSDSNRFLFDTSSYKTFSLVSYYLKKYKFTLSDVYKKLYIRPLREIRLEGYIKENMNVSENKVASILITDDIVTKFKADSASSGNMINFFNYIDEVLVWVIATEDVKNNNIRVNIRSRGPVINKVAEKYNGGGHVYASGARLENFDIAKELINDLDKVTKEYIESETNDEDK